MKKFWNMLSFKNETEISETSKETMVLESDEMGIVDINYSNVIEEIHNEFNTAGEKLLASAKEIISQIHLKNVEKMEMLERFKFYENSERNEYRGHKNKKDRHQKTAEMVEYFMKTFPNYKYITEDIAKKICLKYNLVLGETSQYKGFVPNKNLQEIAKFFELYPKLEDKDLDWRGKATLKICAPLKDMELKNGQEVLDGYKLSIPDPVILYPIEYSYQNGYLILTAWGDEASDELVVNQKFN